MLTGSGWENTTLITYPRPDNTVDTDGDGLTDWEEIDTESGLITFKIFVFKRFSVVNITKPKEDHKFNNNSINFCINDIKTSTTGYYAPIAKNEIIGDGVMRMAGDSIVTINYIEMALYAIVEEKYSINVADNRGLFDERPTQEQFRGKWLSKVIREKQIFRNAVMQGYFVWCKVCNEYIAVRTPNHQCCLTCNSPSCICPCRRCGERPCECPCYACGGAANPCELCDPPFDIGNVNNYKGVEILDALEILTWLAELNSILNRCINAKNAALIVSEETPAILDAVEILCYLAELPNKITNRTTQ